jgi:hypothetical protein
MYISYEFRKVDYNYKDCHEQERHKKIMIKNGYQFVDYPNCVTVYKKEFKGINVQSK